MALAAYFDGSWDGKFNDSPSVTLAGIASDDDLWCDFDDQWRAILKGDGSRPSAHYMHMKEAIHLEGEFHWRNGWNVKKVNALVGDLLALLKKLDKKRYIQFASSVDMEAHRRLIAEGCSLPSPISLCNDYCPSCALYWYANDYPGIVSEAHFFFDRSEPFETPFKDKWTEKAENVLDVTGEREFWSLIKTVTSAVMKEQPALQAADMLAWGTNRKLVGDPQGSYRDFAYLLKHLAPSFSIEWDEARLRKEYCSQEPLC